MIVGLTSGCFDLVHFGHVEYLARCRSLCDRLIVGVDCDAMVRAAKGPARPIIPEFERLEMIRNLTPVDVAFILTDLEDLDRMVRKFHVMKMFKHEGFVNMEGVVGIGPGAAELVIVPDIPGLVSTSEIIRRIREA